jgi:hypothetical protein
LEYIFWLLKAKEMEISRILIIRAASIVLGALLIDGAFHALLSTPFENADYWLLKAALGIPISLVLFSVWKAQPVRSILIASLVFAGGISIRYRLFEIMFGLPLGARVPDIVFRGSVLSYGEHPVLSALAWFAVHLAAFGLPAALLHRKLVSSSS